MSADTNLPLCCARYYSHPGGPHALFPLLFLKKGEVLLGLLSHCPPSPQIESGCEQRYELEPKLEPNGYRLYEYMYIFKLDFKRLWTHPPSPFVGLCVLFFLWFRTTAKFGL